MIDRLGITDEYSVKCIFILNTVIFIDAALSISLKNENVMIYGFIYFSKGPNETKGAINLNCTSKWGLPSELMKAPT